MSSSGILNVLIVDDDPIVPQYEAQMLRQFYDSARCEIVATIWEGKQKLQTADNAYDLILLDLLLPDGSGTDILDFLRLEIFGQKPPVLITSGVNDPATASHCRACGASGYVSRLELPTSLVPAVRAVLGGQEYFPVLPGLSAAGEQSTSRQLPQQMQLIAAALGAGKSSREVADSLGLPESTVRNALPDLMRFHEVDTRGELLRVLVAKHAAQQ